MEKSKMVRTSFTAPEDLLERFKRYCEKERRSVSAQLTYMIEKELGANNDNNAG